jgi:hypothetical protein
VDATVCWEAYDDTRGEGRQRGYNAATRFDLRQELGRNYLDERERAAIARESVRRLERPGFQVTLHTVGEVA